MNELIKKSLIYYLFDIFELNNIEKILKIEQNTQINRKYKTLIVFVQRIKQNSGSINKIQLIKISFNVF